MNVNENGNLSIISNGTVLDDLNDQIYSISEYEPESNINIYIGLFNIKRRRIRNKGINIGVQTEHMLDMFGRSLWNSKHGLSLLYHFSKYDRILDLSFQNIYKYKYFPEKIKENIGFGPYIFPNSKQPFDKEHTEPILHIGTLNKKRREIIDELQKDHDIKVVSPGTFGEELYNEIRDCGGILNIHYDNGIYNEYTRLLLALQFGKAVYSERMAPPLLSNYHYLSIDNIKKDSGQKEKIYNNMSNLLTSKFSFDDYILSIDRQNNDATFEYY